ncbi:hypothetical protein Vretifemale_8349 [Volvox reticuliferus]|uniref:Uncharacterized protein n=1 Tax=Volvox reticuliferus TaxID=1737510 RepID=A0A8J4FN44_9CHLO|nr:hypothetical protein Vretifemale_8349 [Volvox reticuliferus]
MDSETEAGQLRAPPTGNRQRTYLGVGRNGNVCVCVCLCKPVCHFSGLPAGGPYGSPKSCSGARHHPLGASASVHLVPPPPPELVPCPHSLSMQLLPQLRKELLIVA